MDLDKNLIIKCAKETKNLFTVEDHSIIGGLGSAVCEVLADEYPIKVTRIGVKDTFGQSGTAEELLDYYKISAKYIVQEIENGKM